MARPVERPKCSSYEKYFMSAFILIHRVLGAPTLLLIRAPPRSAGLPVLSTFALRSPRRSRWSSFCGSGRGNRLRRGGDVAHTGNSDRLLI